MGFWLGLSLYDRAAWYTGKHDDEGNAGSRGGGCMKLVEAAFKCGINLVEGACNDV
jgi:hypothetical protein